jgi:hypothetical protein
MVRSARVNVKAIAAVCRAEFLRFLKGDKLSGCENVESSEGAKFSRGGYQSSHGDEGYGTTECE